MDTPTADTPHGTAGAETAPILRPGVNCWRLERAARVGLIVDTAAYFEALREACDAARHSILILGWDFDRREPLGRGAGTGEPDPPPLAEYLARLLERNPELEIHLLIWDFHVIYTPERELFQRWRLRLQGHTRLHLQLDSRHPPGGSQHQKLVVVDDRLAFAGGIDLSRWRWDTPAHRPDDPRRIDPDGKPYPPFHDLMMAVDGPAARALGELARARWDASGSPGRPPAPAPATGTDPWPPSVEPALRDQEIAIARTLPEYEDRVAVREVERLYLDGIEAARRWIYIENQYFTSQRLTSALARRLQEPDGPEVMLVLPRHTGGWLEQVTMDALRGRRLETLRQADRHHRFGVYHPHQPGLGEEECISVHAKLLVVDDRLLRIGSSNTSDRSLGLDSECDLALEADAGEAAREAVRNFRHRLLGEHLDRPAAAVAAEETRQGSLLAAVERLRGEGRSLRPLESDGGAAAERLPDSGLIDPDEPISPDYFVRRFIPASRHGHGRRRLGLFLGFIGVLLTAAAAWRWSPLAEWLTPERLAAWLETARTPVIRETLVLAAFVAASLLMAPLTLLVVAAGLLLGPWLGFACAFAGALISALCGFLLGRVLGRSGLDRLSGSRLHRLSRRLADQGILAVAMLRLVPVAPYTVVNLVAGATHLRLGAFLLGSALGLAPGVLGLAVFSGSLLRALADPGPGTLLLLVAVAAVLVGGALTLRRLLGSGRSG